MNETKRRPEPRHGHAFNTRGTFALEQDWLDEWHVHEFEGGKGFPTNEIAGIDKYCSHEEPCEPGPPDNLICSGGKTMADDPFKDHDWEIVNFTDAELQAAKGKTWPRIDVSSGQEFEIEWRYHAPHPTRGYNYWITRNGWNPNERIRVDQLEAVPFYMQHYEPKIPWGEAPTKTTVTLPQKSGYHVMIVAWIVGDTAKAFYQTFDLQFAGSNPQVVMASPQTGDVIRVPNPVSVRVEAVDLPDGVTVTKIKIVRQRIEPAENPVSLLEREEPTFPVEYAWTDPALGRYHIWAIVTLSDGTELRTDDGDAAKRTVFRYEPAMP